MRFWEAGNRVIPHSISSRLPYFRLVFHQPERSRLISVVVPLPIGNPCIIRRSSVVPTVKQRTRSSRPECAVYVLMRLCSKAVVLHDLFLMFLLFLLFRLTLIQKSHLSPPVPSVVWRINSRPGISPYVHSSLIQKILVSSGVPSSVKYRLYGHAVMSILYSPLFFG